MSQEQDKIFFRNFTLVLVFIAAMMIAFYIVADLVTNKEKEPVKNEMNVNSVINITTGNINNGKSLSQTCAVCHGPDGNSVNPIWPKLAGQHASYTAKQLKMFKKGERNNDTNNVMRSIASRMTKEQIEAVSEYIQGLRLQ